MNVTYILSSGHGGPIRAGHAPLEHVADTIRRLQEGNPEQLHLIDLIAGGEFLHDVIRGTIAAAGREIRGDWHHPDTLADIGHTVTSARNGDQILTQAIQTITAQLAEDAE